MLTAVTELSFVAQLGLAVLQTPSPESKWLPDFVHRITPTDWVIIAIVAVVLLGVILYFFTIDGIELGFPPKITFKRRGHPGRVESEIQVAPSAPQPITQTASSHGINVGHDLSGPTFTGEIHGDVIIGSRPESERHPVKEPSQSGPLSPNLVHPYPLQANFTGRVNERAELTAWLEDDEHPIHELVAIGGMGKSALTWVWLTRDVVSSSDLKLDGVMWWSFYEGESSFAKFVEEALKYVSGQPIDAERFPTTYDRAQELRRLLQNKRVLFVLDGFERQLRAYASLDAAYKSHDADSSAEARSCVDPITSRLLREIAAVTTHAKVLLTSRLTVSDLEDRAGDPLAGVVERELKELSRDDAIAFMRAQGVKKGTDAEIANVCEGYGYHALSLRLLSGLIARDAKMSGDIAAAPRHDVFDDLVQRQHHVLERSYDALPKRERALLSRFAAFRSPMTYDALMMFNTFGNEARFEAALDDLRVRGLLQRDAANNRYDLHPIVRHYAYDRLIDKTGVHSRLRDYFAKIPVPDEAQVVSIEDLAPVIELYHHTVRGRRYDEACDLYYTRLIHLLYFRFGAYSTCVELLRALFPDGEDQPPRLKNKADQAWTLGALANTYGLSGQSRNAVPIVKQSIALREELDDKKNLVRGLSNIADDQLRLGELAAAEQNQQRGIDLCRVLQDENDEATVRYELGRTLAWKGQFDEAEVQFSSAFEVKRDHIQAQGIISTYRAQLALLMGDASTALEATQKAHAIATSRHNERDRVVSEWLLGAALLMEGKDLNTANTHLAEALTRCRRINLVELEPDILLEWARWHRAKGNADDAKSYADEALAIADRCEYRLAQADIHNFLARLALDAGDRDKARKEAEIAKERAWCDGPPHCYKPALDEAEKMLKELGAKE
jgi:tetratricopeptide (TPR) repeat protein